MKIYLINKETNEIINIFDNVIEWSPNYVLYKAGMGRGKIYAGENEYFTDKNPKNK